jgi:hypothetical protein
MADVGVFVTVSVVVDVIVDVAVIVGVEVNVLVGPPTVFVIVGVAVTVEVDVTVNVAVCVALLVTVELDVTVDVVVAVRVVVLVNVSVGVLVMTLVEVFEGPGVKVLVAGKVGLATSRRQPLKMTPAKAGNKQRIQSVLNFIVILLGLFIMLGGRKRGCLAHRSIVPSASSKGSPTVTKSWVACIDLNSGFNAFLQALRPKHAHGLVVHGRDGLIFLSPSTRFLETGTTQACSWTCGP